MIAFLFALPSVYLYSTDQDNVLNDKTQVLAHIHLSQAAFYLTKKLKSSLLILQIDWSSRVITFS